MVVTGSNVPEARELFLERREDVDDTASAQIIGNPSERVQMSLSRASLRIPNRIILFDDHIYHTGS